MLDLENGHRFELLRGVRGARLDATPINRLPDDGWIHESWKTSVGYLAHALHRVRKGKVQTIISSTSRRDDPELTPVQWGQECIAAGVPDMGAQIQLIPEKTPSSKPGCTCQRNRDRLKLPWSDGNVTLKGKKATLKKDGKTWVATVGAEVFSGTKAAVQRWAEQQLLTLAFPSLTIEDGGIVTEWKLEGEIFMVKEGRIRMQVVKAGEGWSWSTRTHAGESTGTAATRRGAQKAAVQALI